MRPVTQRIEHQEVKALKALHRLVGDRIAVSDVGHPADAESRDGHLPVPDQQGLDDPSKELKRTGDLVRLSFGKGPVVVVEVENVPRDLSQGLKGLFGGVKGDHFPLHLVIAANVVDAKDMVRVRVGVEQGIETGSLARSAWSLNSAGVSMTMCLSPSWTQTEDLIRWLRGSSDVQTAHVQPMTGTPCDVPVPRKCKRIRVHPCRFETRNRSLVCRTNSSTPNIRTSVWYAMLCKAVYM